MISLIKHWNGSFLRSRSVDFWYFLMSMIALVPGLYLHLFLTSPGVGGLVFLCWSLLWFQEPWRSFWLELGLVGPLWSQVPGHLLGSWRVGEDRARWEVTILFPHPLNLSLVSNRSRPLHHQPLGEGVP